jgi:hypothetical protein
MRGVWVKSVITGTLSDAGRVSETVIDAFSEPVNTNFRSIPPAQTVESPGKLCVETELAYFNTNHRVSGLSTSDLWSQVFSHPVNSGGRNRTPVDGVCKTRQLNPPGKPSPSKFLAHRRRTGIRQMKPDLPKPTAADPENHARNNAFSD